VDVDEWGQVVIINMLTRYARTQFVDPNKYINSVIFWKNKIIKCNVCFNLNVSPNRYFITQDEEDDEENRPFYDDEEETENGKDTKNKKPSYSLDPDHRLLLKNSKPLLQSRNASVS
jgi:AP-3 complex subunit beta